MLEENFRFRDNLLFWAVQLKNFLTNKKTWCWAAAGWLLLPQPLAIAHAQPLPHKDTRPAYLKLVVSDAQPLPTLSLPQLEEVPVPAPEPPPAPPTPVCETGVTSTNYALNQLIQHESGGRSCAENGGGCFGLLQACPGQPLKDACGPDATCQLDWFARYKLPTYGSWDVAWAMWQSRCGSPQGCWW